MGVGRIDYHKKALIDSYKQIKRGNFGELIYVYGKDKYNELLAMIGNDQFSVKTWYNEKEDYGTIKKIRRK